MSGVTGGGVTGTPALDGLGFLIVASGPLGTSLAEAAADRGAMVVVCRPSGAGAGGRPARLDAHDERSATVVADMTVEEGVEELYDLALGRLPRLDALIVAPWSPPALPLAALASSAWDEVLRHGLRCPFLLCQRAIQEWLALGGGGRIVVVPPPVQATHAAQVPAAVVQEALVSLTRSIAKEYGARGVSCNALLRDAPVSGPLRPGVIDAAVFLASPEASYLTGEIVRAGGA